MNGYLFRALEPDVHKHYSKVFKQNNGDIYRSLFTLYNVWRQELEKIGKSPVKREEFEEMVQKENLRSFTQIAIASTLVKGFEKNRNRSVIDLAEEWIASLNWAHYSTDEALFYLEQLKSLDGLTHLNLRNCEALTDKNTIECLAPFKALKRVTLCGKTSLTLIGIDNLLGHYRGLTLKINFPSIKLTISQIKTLHKEYRGRFSLRLNLLALKLQPKQIYSLAKTFKEHLEVVAMGKKKEKVFRIGRKLEQAELLMDQLIQSHCRNPLLFEVIVLMIKKHPMPKDVHLNMRLRDGSTFLHQAAMNENQELYKALVKAGADATLKDVKGKTPAELF